MNKTINDGDRQFAVGYIFSGKHAHANGHMGTLNELSEIESIHLCGIEGAEAEIEEKTSLSSKVKSATTSVEELLAGPKLDAVIVCLRSDICAEVLQDCVDAGLPVVFEKPGALSATKLKRVANNAREKGLTIGTMFQNRWTPVIQDAKRALRDGAFGRIMTVEARLVTSQVRYRIEKSGWMFERATAGSGILGWLGCHYIDLLCYLLGERIVEVTAMVGAQNPEEIDVEDTAFLAVKFSSGVLGTLHFGYHLAGGKGAPMSNDTFIALRGVDGYARIDGSLGHRYSLYSVAPGWASGGLRERAFKPPETAAYGGLSGEEFIAAFLRASRTGAPAPAPIESMVHVLDVIEAALNSSETGRSVRIFGD